MGKKVELPFEKKEMEEDKEKNGNRVVKIVEMGEIPRQCLMVMYLEDIKDLLEGICDHLEIGKVRHEKE